MVEHGTSSKGFSEDVPLEHPEPTFDHDGYPTEETLATITAWDWHDFPALMEYVKRAWCDYGFFDNEPSRVETLFPGCEQDGCYWYCATGGWSGNESILGALATNEMFMAVCWNASARGGYHEYHVVPLA